MMARTTPAIRPTEAEVRDRMAFADAALALARHEVADPTLRALLERVARNELTGNEARDAMRRHVQG